MRFQIVTPERLVFSDEIDQISMMTKDGEITIMAHHIPLVTNLKPGELRYKKQGEEFGVAVSGGFGVVRDDGSVVVLALFLDPRLRVLTFGERLNANSIAR
jgi:F-type H+-transporting ATPase subunit epsilon